MEEIQTLRKQIQIAGVSNMNASKRREIFTRFLEANPDPRTELHYKNTFELLIAVVLSAQSTDKAVNAATVRLFEKAPDPRSMLELGLPRVKDLIKTIGLYNNKAKNLIEISRLLLEKHDGEVPDSRKALTALPGVGRKTANVILNTAFGQPTMAVDTHIFRISNRIPIAPGKNVEEVEKNLLKTIPKEFLINAHHWLILHGRYTCTARKPLCDSCIIYDLCEYSGRKLSNLGQ